MKLIVGCSPTLQFPNYRSVILFFRCFSTLQVSETLSNKFFFFSPILHLHHRLINNFNTKTSSKCHTRLARCNVFMLILSLSNDSFRLSENLKSRLV